MTTRAKWKHLIFDHKSQIYTQETKNLSREHFHFCSQVLSETCSNVHASRILSDPSLIKKTTAGGVMAEALYPFQPLSRGVLQTRAVGSSTLPIHVDGFQRGSSSSTSSRRPARQLHWSGFSLALGVSLKQRYRTGIKKKAKSVALCAGAVQYGDEFIGEEVDDDLADSLKQRTLEALDLDFILEKLQALCYTATAAEMAVDPEKLLAQSPEEARALYDTVLELTQLEDADLDLEARLDISDEARALTSCLILNLRPFRLVRPSQMRWTHAHMDWCW